MESKDTVLRDVECRCYNLDSVWNPIGTLYAADGVCIIGIPCPNQTSSARLNSFLFAVIFLPPSPSSLAANLSLYKYSNSYIFIIVISFVLLIYCWLCRCSYNISYHHNTKICIYVRKNNLLACMA